MQRRDRLRWKTLSGTQKEKRTSGLPQVEVKEENAVTHMETESKKEQQKGENMEDIDKHGQFKSSLTQTKWN
eukprot:3475752-Heterocapsa_arctica.AAC.1